MLPFILPKWQEEAYERSDLGGYLADTLIRRGEKEIETGHPLLGKPVSKPLLDRRVIRGFCRQLSCSAGWAVPRIHGSVTPPLRADHL